MIKEIDKLGLSCGNLAYFFTLCDTLKNGKMQIIAKCTFCIMIFQLILILLAYVTICRKCKTWMYYIWNLHNMKKSQLFKKMWRLFGTSESFGRVCIITIFITLSINDKLGWAGAQSRPRQLDYKDKLSRVWVIFLIDIPGSKRSVLKKLGYQNFVKLQAKSLD